MTTDASTEVRGAVRRALADLAPEVPVVVGCSGGADSLALAAAAAWLSQRDGRVTAAVVIDHALTPGSDRVANAAATQCEQLGLTPVVVRAVDARSYPGGDGPEAAARDARRTALEREAVGLGAGAVLLAHTRDDQAETVLLRLARGSGARSLAAMSPVSGIFRRPLLAVSRDVVRNSARELGLVAHDDPHNADYRFARSRVRHSTLPVLERDLGPGVGDSLARTAELLRDDADLLDELADDALASLPDDLPVSSLAGLPRALRTRVLKALLLNVGCSRGALTRDHVLAVDHLVTDPRVTGPVSLPGGCAATRECGRLILHAPPHPRQER